MTGFAPPAVLFAAAELAPLARVGGMAEAASGLVRALRDLGTDVLPVLPDYGTADGPIALSDEVSIELSMPDWAGPTRARRGTPEGVDNEVIFVDAPGLARPHPYVDPTTGMGWPDNDYRFFVFSAAIAELTRLLKPNVLHLNDWHTAAALGFLSADETPSTVLTIHTLGYQGVCSAEWLQRIPHESWRFAWYDVANPLVGAIRSADRIIAVSPNYAREILTEADGMGMHDELARRGDALVGIRNGIDASVWTPVDNPHLAVPYGVKDRESGKAAARAALVKQAGWDDDGSLLITVVSRLVDQKGIDLAMALAPYLASVPARIFVLGSGQANIAELVRETADANPDRIFAVTDRYDEPLAHRLFAGGDVFMMPSRFEPCGLAQMQSMAFGTPAIATPVGGLVDTIIDVDAEPKMGTGFLAQSNDVAGLVDAVHRAARTMRAARTRKAIQKRGMTHDWSWVRPAQHHLDLYAEISN